MGVAVLSEQIVLRTSQSWWFRNSVQYCLGGFPNRKENGLLSVASVLWALLLLRGIVQFWGSGFHNLMPDPSPFLASCVLLGGLMLKMSLHIYTYKVCSGWVETRCWAHRWQWLSQVSQQKLVNGRALYNFPKIFILGFLLSWICNKIWLFSLVISGVPLRIRSLIIRILILTPRILSCWT